MTARRTDATTSVPTVIFRPDCVIRRSSGPTRPSARDSTRSARLDVAQPLGRSLELCRFHHAGAALAPRRLRTFRSFDDSGRTISAKYAPSMIARTTTNVTATMTICPSCVTAMTLMCSNMSAGSWTPAAASRSRHFGRMPVARNWPLHLAVGADAGPFEQEDVLHRDDLAFHAGDLGDRRHLPACRPTCARPAPRG